MKKELSILFILLILSTTIPFILAEGDAQEESRQVRESLNTDFGSIVEGIEVENVFKREVEVPSIVRFILGIKGENILTWEKLILTIGAWIIFFIIIHATVSIVPFFIGKEKIQFGVSFIVLMLISMTTGVTYLVEFFIGIFDAATFLDELGPVKIFLSILVLIIGIKGAGIVSSKLKESLKMEGAAEAGKNINIQSKVGKIQKDSLKELNE